MVFDRPFWGDNKVELLNRVSPADKPGSWAEFYSMQPIIGELLATGPASSRMRAAAAAACCRGGPPWVAYAAALLPPLLPAPPHAGKPVLVGFNAADYAWQLEKKSDAETKDECMAVLRTMFKNAPEPISVSGLPLGQPACQPRMKTRSKVASALALCHHDLPTCLVCSRVCSTPSPGGAPTSLRWARTRTPKSPSPMADLDSIRRTTSEWRRTFCVRQGGSLVLYHALPCLPRFRLTRTSRHLCCPAAAPSPWPTGGSNLRGSTPAPTTRPP